MQRGSPKGLKRNLTTRAMLVRPYTVRKGDTVFKISQKRGAMRVCFFWRTHCSYALGVFVFI